MDWRTCPCDLTEITFKTAFNIGKERKARFETRGDAGLNSDSVNFFPRIDYSHCDRVHSYFTADHCPDNDYVGK